MNTYLIGVKKYFGGEYTFEIEAENKTDALIKARGGNAFIFCRDNVDDSTRNISVKMLITTKRNHNTIEDNGYTYWTESQAHYLLLVVCLH